MKIYIIQSVLMIIIGVRGMGLARIFQIAIFLGENMTFGQNHLIFGQAMENIFGQETSDPPPPPNETRTPMMIMRIIYLH